MAKVMLPVSYDEAKMFYHQFHPVFFFLNTLESVIIFQVATLVTPALPVKVMHSESMKWSVSDTIIF